MKVAVIGAGTIGQSWAKLFASHGHEVVLSDPREDLGEIVSDLAGEVPAGAGSNSAGSVRAAEGGRSPGRCHLGC